MHLEVERKILMKKKLYIVFEKIHPLSTGGLVATYTRLVPLLKKKYDVKIISVFSNVNPDCLFEDCEIISLSNKNLDLNFPKLFEDLKKFHLISFFQKFYHMIYCFCSAPFLRKKMRNILSSSDHVLVTCPFAAMFMPKNFPFILEIHIYYEYFFGHNLLGSLQVKMMTKPALTLFRTASDAKKAENFMNASYVYNFMDNEGIIPRKQIVKNKICYVGRLNEQKNPLRLIEIARLLKEKYPDFILDIYGTGDYYDKMKEKIVEYQLEDHVFLKGFTSDKNIYKNYSLLWMTSLFEGLSLVMIEAKANGIPIITTSCGEGVKEVIHDGVDGFIIDDNEAYVDKTIELFENEKLLKKVSDNSLKDFKRFSKEQAYENWMMILADFSKKFLDKK